jgi:hypothetical protein
MNAKYQRYIEYIVNDLEIPYFKNMRDNYGLSPDEYELVLSKVFNQDVKVENVGENMYVYDSVFNTLYYENNSNGYWVKKILNAQKKLTYKKDSTGFWQKWEYDNQGNNTYYEDSEGNWYRKEYNEQGREVYYIDSYGDISDRR